MLNLKFSTTDKLQITTSSGADIDCCVVFVDSDATITTSSDMVADRQLAAVTTATTADICATPASGKTRNVKRVTLRNIDASLSNDVTVLFNNNGTTYTLVKCTLLAGEVLALSEGVWFHYDSNGGVYSGVPYAAQADQEAGTSTALVVSPGTQHYHPSASKCWGKVTVSAGTPTLQVSYNITSITDTATDRLTVTIGNDFSSANYACLVSLEAATTTLSATTTSLACFVRNATLAAGSFEINACEFDIGQATDPSSWSWACFGDL